MKYFSLKVVCEDQDAIRHGQAYVVGTFMLCATQMQMAVYAHAMPNSLRIYMPAHKYISVTSVSLHGHHPEHACWLLHTPCSV